MAIPRSVRAFELVLQVLHFGLCHSDISMLDNHWGMTRLPLIPGHEVVGRVVRAGLDKW